MKGWQLLVVLMGFFLGVLVESLYLLPATSPIWITVAAFVLALGWRRSQQSALLVGSLCLLLVCLGVVRTQIYERQFLNSILTNQVGEKVTITGSVIREPDKRTNFTQVYVQTETDRVLVRVDRFVTISYGDVLQVSGKLVQPDAFQTDTGRTFDYPKYLEVRGVQYVISFAEVAVLMNDQGSQLLSLLYKTKSYFVDTLERVIASPQVDLGVGLLLGVKQALGDDLEAAFRQTGIIHIVVLSGYNVMLIVGFFWWISSWVLPLRGRIIFGLLGITLFALLVGLSATVVRASIMAAILLIGKLLGREYDVLRALLFAAGVMVLLNPYILLYDIGFQLSFMATLGLVLFLPQFESTVATKTTSLKLKDLFLATLITQIFVLPLLMYYIGEVSLVSVLVNMLVLPVVPIAMLLTFVAGMLTMLSVQLGAIVGVLAYLSLAYIILVAEWFASLPFAYIIVPEISVGLVVFIYVVLGLLYWWRMQTKKDSAAGSSSLSDWTVVEEVQEKDSMESVDSILSDPPVFFR
jgi:competence protein ComEC